MRARFLKYAGGVAAGAMLVTLATGAGDAERNPDYGFVVSNFNISFHRGEEKIDCPAGRSLSLRETYVASLPAAERERLLKPENSDELNKDADTAAFGPAGRDICSNPELFATDDRPLQQLTQSKIGPGMDLDGAPDGQATPGTCAHDSFASPSGERGVDNQFFRVVACNSLYRGPASSPGSGGGDGAHQLRWENNTLVVTVRDVQSWRNDASVQLVLANSPDRPTVVGGGANVASGTMLDGGSFVMTSNPRHRVVAHGRIENGVLITDPVDMVMPYNWVGASGGEFMLRRVRFRLRLAETGMLEGEAGGYRPIVNAMGNARVAGPGYATGAGVDCASFYKTLMLMADGDPDPKTGKCTSISQGFVFSAVPAFVFDDGKLVAAPRGPTRSARN